MVMAVFTLGEGGQAGKYSWAGQGGDSPLILRLVLGEGTRHRVLGALVPVCSAVPAGAGASTPLGLRDDKVELATDLLGRFWPSHQEGL